MSTKKDKISNVKTIQTKRVDGLEFSGEVVSVADGHDGFAIQMKQGGDYLMLKLSRASKYVKELFAPVKKDKKNKIFKIDITKI